MNKQRVVRSGISDFVENEAGGRARAQIEVSGFASASNSYPVTTEDGGSGFPLRGFDHLAGTIDIPGQGHASQCLRFSTSGNQESDRESKAFHSPPNKGMPHAGRATPSRFISRYTVDLPMPSWRAASVGDMRASTSLIAASTLIMSSG